MRKQTTEQITKGKRCHKWSRIKRLNENVTEKMCSSDGNVVGEMCSPADTDTCGDGSTAFPQKARRTYQRKS